MPDRVLIAVDRKEAEWFTTPGNEGSTAASKYVRYAVRAALDRDRDELIEAVAKALNPSVFRDDLTWSHSEMPEAGRVLARADARRVLSAIEEADHG